MPYLCSDLKIMDDKGFPIYPIDIPVYGIDELTFQLYSSSFERFLLSNQVSFTSCTARFSISEEDLEDLIPLRRFLTDPDREFRYPDIEEPKFDDNDSLRHISSLIMEGFYTKAVEEAERAGLLLHKTQADQNLSILVLEDVKRSGKVLLGFVHTGSEHVYSRCNDISFLDGFFPVQMNSNQQYSSTQGRELIVLPLEPKDFLRLALSRTLRAEICRDPITLTPNLPGFRDLAQKAKISLVK